MHSLSPLEDLFKQSSTRTKMPILKSKIPNLDIPENLTFSEFISSEARKSPNKTALVSI